MSDKPFEPTAKRLHEARQRGEVVRSVELNAAVGILAGVILLQGPGEKMFGALAALMENSLEIIGTLTRTGASFSEIAMESLVTIAPSLGVFVLGMLVVGVAVTISQTGFLWAGKRIGIDLSRLNPVNGMKRIFSSQGLVEFLKALIKLLAVGFLVYSYLKNNLENVLVLGQMGLGAGIQQWAQMAYALSFRVGGAYLVIAAADYAFQRWRFMKSLRMTREEVKEEMKQSEGDPQIKRRIQQQQRRFARMRMMAKVPEADVIITNPTHLAIAVKYDPKNMGAPVVLAKGAFRTAERIVALAAEHEIPVVQNVPLARAIYRAVEIDQEIPADLYLAMAEVLAYVYNLRSGRQSSRPIGRSN